MEQLAESGHIYLTADTKRLIEGFFVTRDLGGANVPGVDEPVGVHELESAGSSKTRLDVSRARGLTKFVGRTDEMQILDSALSRAQSGHGQAVGVVGEPGVGKSRLCYEFVEQCRAKAIPVYEAHCPAHGKNIPYLPILELYRNYFGIKAHDTAAEARHKIAGALLLLDEKMREGLPALFDFMGVADPNEPAPKFDAETLQRQMFAIIHQVTRAQAARGITQVILIDDLHWVDAGSDVIIAQLVAAADGNRSLVLLNFRPEYQAD